ncbi:hypothetical protein N7526_004967 [Penicillium atrosanguineum]|nr:hypothetical protein N7526_004967 [Penicillium atrosanguineum]
MSDFQAFQADLFLLPYWDQQRRLANKKVRDLSSHSQELLDRIRLPAERVRNDDPCWVRTCYDPSSEDSWAQIQEYIDTKVGGPVTVYNDPALYNFGSNWEKTFLRAPQLLDNRCSFEEYEERVQEALEEAIEYDTTDPQRAEEEGYDLEEDENPWICFYSDYLFQLVIGYIYVVDKRTLASEGPDAGTVLIVWYDECGRAIRSYREKSMKAAEIANLGPSYLQDRAVWTQGEIGESYQWGAPLGPPYNENDREESG